MVIDPLWMADYVTGEMINVLAKENPIYNDDLTTMTVKLREGIYWNDGVPFTADDVVYTVELSMETPGFGYHTQFNQDVAKVYKTDDYTVVFELRRSPTPASTISSWIAGALPHSAQARV